jgi:DUF4097 and DUF4098 domain-containing protein YvlB
MKDTAARPRRLPASSSPSRSAPRWSGLVLPLLVLLTGLAAPAFPEVLREETSDRYRLAPGAAVEIENVNGDLEFSSWDQPDVLLEVTKVVKTLGHGRASRALSDLEVEVEESADALSIKTKLPPRMSGLAAWLTGGHIQARVTYRVTLPRGVRVVAATVNGDIVMDSLSGSIDAETTNGQIHIVEAAGAGRASTTNGNIRAEFRQLAEGSNLELRTTNGGIVVYVPGSTRAEIDASTVNGAVTSDFAVLSDGSTSWRRKSLRGAINGGGGRVTLETVNGSIQLRKGSDEG